MCPGNSRDAVTNNNDVCPQDDTDDVMSSYSKRETRPDEQPLTLLIVIRNRDHNRDPNRDQACLT